MQIQGQRQGAVTVLRPAGPLTAPEIKDFRATADRAISSNLGRIVLDMAAIPYLDSEGLEALVDLTEELAQSGQSLKLCAPNKTIREVLSLTDLAPLFEQFEDVGTAVRSFL